MLRAADRSTGLTLGWCRANNRQQGTGCLGLEKTILELQLGAGGGEAPP